MKKTKNTYPQWIDEYSRSVYQAYTHAIPNSFGPIDVFAILWALNGAFIAKIYNAVLEIKKKKISTMSVAESFSSPSALRFTITLLTVEYQGSKVKDREQFKEIVEFLLDVLTGTMVEDVFCMNRNIAHTPSEVAEILLRTPWQQGNSERAREVGKFYNSAFSLGYALYRDFFPQDAIENYGPYDASARFGAGAILVIKHVQKIKVPELWKETASLRYKEIKIFQIYRKVKFRCEYIGEHSVYEGDIINNLVSYAVSVDGAWLVTLKDIKEASDYLAEAASKHFLVYETMSHDDLKMKALEWICFQCIGLFRLVGMDWRPTTTMRDAVKNARIPERFELSSFSSYKKFTTSKDYEVYWLKDLYRKK